MGLCWRLPWGTFLPRLQGLFPAFSKAAAGAPRRRRCAAHVLGPCPLKARSPHASEHALLPPPALGRAADDSLTSLTQELIAAIASPTGSRASRREPASFPVTAEADAPARCLWPRQQSGSSASVRPRVVLCWSGVLAPVMWAGSCFRSVRVFFLTVQIPRCSLRPRLSLLPRAVT